MLSLFCWHLLLYIFGKTRWTGFFVSIIIGISVGYFDSINGYFSLSRTFVFFPYFFLGYLLDKRQLLHMIKSKYSIYIATSILIGAFLTLYFAVNGDINSWLQGDTPYSKTYDFHITGSIVRMFQYGLTILIIFSFLSFIPSIHFFFTFIGQRTLYVYLLHGFIVQSIYTFISIDILKPLSNHYLILLLLFTLCVCLFLGSHIIKKLTSPFIELKIERSSEQ